MHYAEFGSCYRKRVQIFHMRLVIKLAITVFVRKQKLDEKMQKRGSVVGTRILI